MIIINKEKASELDEGEVLSLLNMCPFLAIEEHDGALSINSRCQLCKLCVKNGPKGVFTLLDKAADSVDKNNWQGIAVFIDNTEGYIHPVSLELLGKARELANKVNFHVYALLIGRNLNSQANELLHYNVDEIYLYENDKLDKFLIEPYVNVFEDFVNKAKPSSVLVGATPVGRSLAPRVAARLKTGVTADCTKLDIKQNTDLIQIRPAFGGNIMAQIVTPNHRPQFATVRYKIFNAPERSDETKGSLNYCDITEEMLKSRMKILSIEKKERSKTISEADVIIAAGRGYKAEKDLTAVKELAKLLRAEIAGTRPLIERGWISADRQIGLSGRTVKPKLIITLGVSGSVQFKAGMENSELIISVNTDADAGIFAVSHIAVNGDMYDIVPRLVTKIREGGEMA